MEELLRIPQSVITDDYFCLLASNTPLWRVIPTIRVHRPPSRVSKFS